VQTITVGSTQGEVLAVPAAALSVSADGGTRLQVQRPNGRTQEVSVTPGLAAKGLVAVTPIGDRLGAGDLVVVGRDGERAQLKASAPKAQPGALGFWGPNGH
jgi:hypothetical protein